jgi:hypothetical protein
LVPVSWMPSPESPQKRIATRSICSVGFPIASLTTPL